MPNWKKLIVSGSSAELSALKLTGLSGQGSETTSLMINGSNVIGTRDLGSNAFTSTTIGTTTNALTVDNTTVQLNSGTTFNGSAARTISAKTAAISDGGTALATADQIHTFVTDFGYTTNTGDITGVTAGAGLSGGGSSGGVTLAIDLSEYDEITPANGDALATLDSDGSTEQLTTVGALATLFAGSGLTATNAVIAVDTLNQDTTGNAATATALETARTIAGVSFDGTANISLNNNAITNGAGYTTNTGDITGVTAGAGITGGASSGNATLDLDIDGTNNYIEMNNDITPATGDFIPFSDISDNVVRKTTFSDIPVSILNNDSGFTTNTGDITGVTAGVGLSGGGSSGGVTLTLDLSELSEVTPASGDAFATLDSNGSTEQLTTVDALATLLAGSGLNASSGVLSISETGDISAVTAGEGLIGGGSSGAVTVNVDYDGSDNIILACNNAEATGTLSSSDKILVSSATNDNTFVSTLSNLPFTNNSGDITGVTAGVGLSGGGSSGGVTLTLDLSELSDVTPANGDKLATLDSDGSTEQLTTIASLATLFAGSGLTATNSVIAVDTLNQNTSGNAATATALQTGRTIAGVEFDGTENISLNNNAITNGAGYTTNTGDITGVTAGVGLSGGGSSGGVTLTLDLSELSDVTPANGDKLATLDSDGSTEQLTTVAALATLFAGSGLTATNSVIAVDTLNQDTSGNAATATALESARTIAGVSFDGTENISLNNNAITNGAGYTTNTGTVDTSGTPVDNDFAKFTDANTIEGRSASEMRSDLNVEDGATADQTQADINGLAITEVGTISTGTWNGTAIASAYLDSDTAHLSGTQTFSGIKTFTSKAKFEGGAHFDDNDSITLGTGDDVEIVDDGTDTLVKVKRHGGKLYFQLENDAGTNQNAIVLGSSGSSAKVGVELRYNNVKRLETTTNGLEIRSLGVGADASGTRGEIRATNDITAFYSSDLRLKENIQTIEGTLDKIDNIRAVSYDWKELTEEERKTIHSHTGSDIGVIAQEVEEVFPDLVEDRPNGYKAVNYEKLSAVLLSAVKELKQEVEELKQKIK